MRIDLKAALGEAAVDDSEVVYKNLMFKAFLVVRNENFPNSLLIYCSRQAIINCFCLLFNTLSSNKKISFQNVVKAITSIPMG